MTTRRYFLYFAGSDGRTEQVGVATSPDMQQWQVSPQPVVPVGNAGQWDSVQTSNPSVLFDEGHFRMWYQGVDDGGRYRIGYAESEDGVQWTKQPAVLFERPGLRQMDAVPAREGYHQPLVLRDDDRYLMYFLDHRDGLGYVRVATSADGFAWTPIEGDCIRPEKSWESHGLHYPWVLREEGRYVMWYTSLAAKFRWYLTRAVSGDGIHWQREPDRPVIDIRLARSVSPLNLLIPRKLLRRFPSYFNADYRQSLPHRNWPRGVFGTLLLQVHDRLIFPFRDRRYISFENSSIIVQDDGRYLMCFQGRTENQTAFIGTATSADGIQWQPQQTGILRPAIEQIAWCSFFDADPHLLVLEEDA